MQRSRVRHRTRAAASLGSAIVLGLVLGACSDAHPPGAEPQVTASTPVTSITATLPTIDTFVATAPSSAKHTTAAAADSTEPSSTKSATTGLLLLSKLPIKARGEKTGYSREQYGEAWTDDVPVDDGRNGCSTREDILRRDLSLVVMMTGSDDCTVLSGTLNDQYTATAIPYLHSASSPIDIDHVVALSDAWQTGANSFAPALRRNLANDPLNLQAVSSQANRQKGDGDTATWLPPNKAYRCEYVRRQIDVKAKYGLWVKPAESDAMKRVLIGCGGIPPILTADSSAASSTISMPMTAPPDSATTTPTGYDDYFPDCAAAKAAGRAPLLRGEAGYRAEMDGDDDGVACEVAH